MDQQHVRELREQAEQMRKLLANEIEGLYFAEKQMLETGETGQLAQALGQRMATAPAARELPGVNQWFMKLLAQRGAVLLLTAVAGAVVASGVIAPGEEADFISKYADSLAGMLLFVLLGVWEWLSGREQQGNLIAAANHEPVIFSPDGRHVRGVTYADVAARAKEQRRRQAISPPRFINEGEQ